MEETDSVLLNRNSKGTCDDRIQTNKYQMKNIIQTLRASRMGNTIFLKSSRCSEEQILQLNFQIKMMQSARNILKASLMHVQRKLKTKYFFGSVLQFMKFLTDIV